MDTGGKKLLVALGTLLFIFLVALGFSFLARQSMDVSVPPISSILKGTATSTNSYEYIKEGEYETIEAVYPAKVTLKGAGAQKAQRTMEQWLADDIARFRKDGNIDNLTPHDIQIMGLGDGRKYAYDVTYKEYQSAKTVSYRFDLYEYTLGAHGNGYYRTFTFDQRGNELKLSDLFISTSTNPQSDWLNRISGIATVQVKDELTRRLGQDPGQSFFTEGTAPQEQNFQHFVLDGDTLRFFFPPYQVAAYVAGSFEVAVPLTQLQDVLK